MAESNLVASEMLLASLGYPVQTKVIKNFIFKEGNNYRTELIHKR